MSKSIMAEVEVTTDDVHFRVIHIPISRIDVIEGNSALRRAQKQMKEGEMVYQICAPCKGCTLSQPFFDYFNGFRLLEASFWRKNNRN